MSRFAPQPRGLLDLPGLGAVTREEFRLVLGDLFEFALEGLSDAGVKRTSWLAQQRAICNVLHQGMVEQVGRLRRRTLPEQQTGRNETVEYRSELRLRLVSPPQPAGRAKTPAQSPLPICATSLAAPSRSSRAISDACRLAGTAKAVGGIARNRPSGVALPLRLQYRLRHFLHEQRNAVRALDNLRHHVRRELPVPGEAPDDGRRFRAPQAD